MAETPDFATGLVGGSLGFGWVDLDAALEVCAVLDADARRENIADDGAITFDVHTATDVNVAHDFSGDHQVARMDFRIELSGGADRQSVAAQRNGAIDFAVNVQGFGTGELTFDFDACAQARRTADSRTAEARVRRRIQWNDWNC
jgi:hypothetical protein